MAKLNALQLTNRVLRNCGMISTDLTALTSLTVSQLIAFNAINEVIDELGISEHWKPLEDLGTITLGSGTATYTQDTDMIDFDTNSFKYNQASKIEFVTPQEFDREHVTQTDTGTPSQIAEFGGQWYPYKIPDVGAHGLTILYRHWTRPVGINTATTTTTCWFPEGFDESILVNLATYKTLHYRGHPEASVYYEKVYGNPRMGKEGNISKMRRVYASPTFKRVPVTAYL